MSKEKKKSLQEINNLKKKPVGECFSLSAYEKKKDDFPWKQIIMGLLFGVILLLMLIQMIVK